MARVQIIGSGNAFNMDGRAHACYLIESDLLLDCGASSVLRMQSLHVDLASIEGVLFTHFHGDHLAGLPFLLLNYKYILKRSESLTILGPRGIQETCERLLELTYPGMTFEFPIHFVEITPDTDVAFKDKTIRGMPVTHRPESLGYRITWEKDSSRRTFAFSGDAAYDSKLFDLVRGVDLAVVELSLVENDGSVAHVALSEVRDGSLRSQRVVYSHVYDELANLARMEGLTVAEDGMILEF